MEKYISIRFQKHSWEDCKSGRKTYRGFYSQRNHNRRTEKQDKNYLLNPQYSHLNLYKDYMTNEDINTNIEKMKSDYKEHYKRGLPSNTKPFINGLITFSNTITEDLDLKHKENRIQLFKIVANFIKKELGNIISLDFHIDETTPHFHFESLNYDFENHITYSRIITDSINDNWNRQNFQQDRLEQHLKKHIKNFDYSRGKVSGKKQYHNDRQKNKQHLQQQETQINEFTSTINEIIEDLETLGEEQDLNKFKKLVDRYFGNQPKLEKLLIKWKKGTQRKLNKTPTPKI